MQKPRVLFVSHGGGPMPLLGDPSHADMVTCLQSIAAKIQKPSAILMVSAHWEANPISITSVTAQSLISLLMLCSQLRFSHCCDRLL